MHPKTDAWEAILRSLNSYPGFVEAMVDMQTGWTNLVFSRRGVFVTLSVDPSSPPTIEYIYRQLDNVWPGDSIG